MAKDDYSNIDFENFDGEYLSDSQTDDRVQATETEYESDSRVGENLCDSEINEFTQASRNQYDLNDKMNPDNYRTKGTIKSTNAQYDPEAHKRAHHNYLERKRRGSIKDGFGYLFSTVPIFKGQKLSRSQILKRSVEYIKEMRYRNSEQQKNINELAQHNDTLSKQIDILEKLLAIGSFQKIQPNYPSQPVRIIATCAYNNAVFYNTKEEPVRRKKRRTKSQRN